MLPETDLDLPGSVETPAEIGWLAGFEDENDNS